MDAFSRLYKQTMIPDLSIPAWTWDDTGVTGPQLVLAHIATVLGKVDGVRYQIRRNEEEEG